MGPGFISPTIRDRLARGWPPYREREARWSTFPAPWRAACCSASRQTATASWSETGPPSRTWKGPCGWCRRAAAPQSGWATSSLRMPPGPPMASRSFTPGTRNCTWPAVTEGRHGGLPRRQARAYWIRWSPDGRHLRFTLIDTESQRRSLWELVADGTDLHALPLQWDARPQECCGEWSRDGRSYVFTAVNEQGADLWMLDETRPIFRGRSWKPRRLTSDSLRSVAAIPSLDGKTLYAVRNRFTPQVLKYDPRSGRLAASPFQRGLGVRFSRDGQWLAYVEVQGTLESRLDLGA
jgi:hypothetical protein